MQRYSGFNNLTKNMASLTEKEDKILGDIRNKVSSTIGTPVKINLGTTSECGRWSIALKGILEPNSQLTFIVMPQMLSEMANDEEKYRYWMSFIQNQIETYIESGRSNNRQQISETNRRGEQVRVKNMAFILNA